MTDEPPRAYRAAWVLPVCGPPLAGGVVEVAGQHITAVRSQPGDVTPVDLGEVVLLPGLVNAHTHLEFSHLDTPLGVAGQPLVEWIPHVIGARREGEARRGSVSLGLLESLAAGTTLLGEIARLGDWPAHSIDVASRSPAYDAWPGATVVFDELKATTQQESDEWPWDAIRAVGQPGARIVCGISPHAPYTVHPTALDRAIKFSQSQKVLLSMHLAESLEELEFIEHGRGPIVDLLAARGIDARQLRGGLKHPGDYLSRLSLAARALVIHGNYLHADELQQLADAADRMTLVHCPRTHAYFGHPRFLLAELMSRGVHVALGTDSRASNPDLSLLAEMRCVARTHPDIAPADVLALGTINGAQALGYLDRGVLRAGAGADLITVPLVASATSDPYETLLGTEAQVRDVCVAGKWLQKATGD